MSFISRPTTPIPLETLHWTPQELWSRLHIPNIDEIDLTKANNITADIICSDRGRAEQMIGTPEFHHWTTSPRSSRLLVHGDFDHAEHTSPFTILCATIVEGLRASRGVISLVFFCGYHLQRDEYYGGTAMIRSLIAQLLRQFPASSIAPDPDFSMSEIEHGSEDQLGRLFIHLVRQLPMGTTIFCLIDGIKEYEREEYLHGMDEVIFSLRKLVDEGSPANFKLLLTSPRPTVEVKNIFDDEPGMLLHMQRLPLIEEGIGSTRLEDSMIFEH